MLRNIEDTRDGMKRTNMNINNHYARKQLGKKLKQKAKESLTKLYSLEKTVT